MKLKKAIKFDYGSWAIAGGMAGLMLGLIMLIVSFVKVATITTFMLNTFGIDLSVLDANAIFALVIGGMVLALFGKFLVQLVHGDLQRGFIELFLVFFYGAVILRLLGALYVLFVSGFTIYPDVLVMLLASLLYALFLTLITQIVYSQVHKEVPN